jgi:HEAT repeats
MRYPQILLILSLAWLGALPRVDNAAASAGELGPIPGQSTRRLAPGSPQLLAQAAAAPADAKADPKAGTQATPQATPKSAKPAKAPKPNRLPWLIGGFLGMAGVMGGAVWLLGRRVVAPTPVSPPPPSQKPPASLHQSLEAYDAIFAEAPEPGNPWSDPVAMPAGSFVLDPMGIVVPPITATPSTATPITASESPILVPLAAQPAASVISPSSDSTQPATISAVAAAAPAATVATVAPQTNIGQPTATSERPAPIPMAPAVSHRNGSSQNGSSQNGSSQNGNHQNGSSPNGQLPPTAPAPLQVAAPTAITATTRLPKGSIVESLIDELRQPDPVQRHKVIWELSQRGDTRAVQPLVDLMVDSDSKQRSLILSALSEIGGRTLRPMSRALAISLQDPNADVRKNAIRDLTRVYDMIAQISQMVQQATEDPDREVQETARWALGQLNRIRPVEPAALKQSVSPPESFS